MRLMVLATLAAASCAPSFHVPADLTGDVPVSISNETTHALCTFEMGSEGRAGNNWIGVSKPRAGKRQDFKMKPGTYWVVVEGCNDSFKAGSTHVVVSGPTELVLTPASGNHVALPPLVGYARQQLPVRESTPSAAPAPMGAPPAGCVADGQPLRDGSESSCCNQQTSSTVHAAHDDNGQVVCCTRVSSGDHCEQ